ncbi:integrator complex subunit 2 [Selaginella moellendorffii]|uniref:integrator complex subunit 2 n=1 Tax=Selaginella moellendorffii TaxID=88036 RepID=UPI000D1C262E|nr:integrator complex subunit 2 [Selaginella moellendorffii]|eukprot:XP_024536342.1 integrator complex subunit 2 [Selaginella moellendorffii]
MADDILEFVRHRVFPERLRAIDASVKLPFAPSLLLAACDDPEQRHCVLGNLEDHRCVSRALEYARLDYGEISCNIGAGAENAAPMDEDGLLDGGESPDECLAFEQATEKGRVELVITSLLGRASKATSNSSMGSIWNNTAYLSELRLLLPIAVSRCPAIFTPELLVKSLLTAACGIELLVTTLANNPSLVERAPTLLVDLVKRELDQESAREKSPAEPRLKPSREMEAAVWTLFKLCQVSRSFASTCRDAMVEAMVLEELALLVTLEVLHDEFEFLSEVLFKSFTLGGTVHSLLPWLAQYLSSREKSLLPLPRMTDKEGLSTPSERFVNKEWVTCELRKALLRHARRIKQKKGWCPELYAHLKIYCVLIRVGDISPSFEESDFWLKTIAQDKTKPPCCSQRILELGVAYLCLVPGLAGSPTRLLYHGCVSYLLSPVKQDSGFSSTVELAIWLSVQLFLRNLNNIAQFVRESLGIHVTVHHGLMHDFASAAGITSDPSLIANAVAALRPQGALAGNVKQQSRALMCLTQLLHAGTFSRCFTDILGAVIHSISRAREPVCREVVHLIQSYMDLPVQQGNAKGPIFKAVELETFLLDAISPGSLSFYNNCSDDGLGEAVDQAPAVLATYFILCREHLLRSLGVDDDVKWWPDLVSGTPWRLVLSYMEKFSSQYENLLPQWLALATALFPEKFIVLNHLDQMEATDRLIDTVGVDVAMTDEHAADRDSLSVDAIQSARKKAPSEPQLILRVLDGMRRRASSYDWKLTDVVGKPSYWTLESTLIKELLPFLLDPTCPHDVQAKFCSWWYALPDAAKEPLIIVFFKAIKVSGSAYTGLLKEDALLSYRTLVRDPLLFLSCDPRLFRTPMLAFYLDTLMEILIVNRRLCEASILESGKDGLRREEIATALVSQYSAVCQILLERCDLSQGKESLSMAMNKLVCKTVSSLLTVNSLLLKLIHFQGYDSTRIPVMLEHVPAMVHCLDFLDELLQQQQQHKQVFAILLASHVTRCYPEANLSFQVAERVVSHVTYILSKVAGSSEFLAQILQPVAEIATTFPVLAPKVVAILQSCSRAGASLKAGGPPRDAKLEAAAVGALGLVVGT